MGERMVVVFEELEEKDKFYNLFKWLQGGLSKEDYRGILKALHIKHTAWGTILEATDAYVALVAMLDNRLEVNGQEIKEGLYEIDSINKSMMVLNPIDGVEVYPSIAHVMSDMYYHEKNQVQDIFINPKLVEKTLGKFYAVKIRQSSHNGACLTFIDGGQYNGKKAYPEGRYMGVIMYMRDLEDRVGTEFEDYIKVNEKLDEN